MPLVLLDARGLFEVRISVPSRLFDPSRLCSLYILFDPSRLLSLYASRRLWHEIQPWSD